MVELGFKPRLFDVCSVHAEHLVYTVNKVFLDGKYFVEVLNSGDPGFLNGLCFLIKVKCIF